MGRLSNLRVVDPVLTQLATGYVNEDFVAEKIFPVVSVAKEAGKIPQFGKEAFMIYDTERAIRANSNVIEPNERTTTSYLLEEHDLAMPVDYREQEEDMFDLESEAVNTVSQLIELEREKKAADIAQTASNYASGNKITLSGTSQFTNAGSDPIGVIEDAKAAIKSCIGSNSKLTMVMGEATYRVLKNHAALLDRIKYSMKGIATTELMKEIFDIPEIVVGKGTYWNGSAFVDLWGDNIVLAVTPTGAKTPRTPSFGYTFRKKGMPQVDKYQREGNKITMIRRTDLYQVKMLSNVGGYLISDTNA